ncbi:hypothetical protein HaLaN_12724, partial [Haematococcus lacustris]
MIDTAALPPFLDVMFLDCSILCPMVTLESHPNLGFTVNCLNNILSFWHDSPSYGRAIESQMMCWKRGMTWTVHHGPSTWRPRLGTRLSNVELALHLGAMKASFGGGVASVRYAACLGLSPGDPPTSRPRKCNRGCAVSVLAKLRGSNAGGRGQSRQEVLLDFVYKVEPFEVQR